MRFAEDAGVCRAFFAPPDHASPNQTVTAFVEQPDDQLRAVAVLFEESREIGLWVPENARHRGIGTSLFLTAIKSQTHAPLFATIAVTNPNRDAMARILARAGFAPYLSARGHAVWRRRAMTPYSAASA